MIGKIRAKNFRADYNDVSYKNKVISCNVRMGGLKCRHSIQSVYHHKGLIIFYSVQWCKLYVSSIVSPSFDANKSFHSLNS